MAGFIGLELSLVGLALDFIGLRGRSFVDR